MELLVILRSPVEYRYHISILKILEDTKALEDATDRSIPEWTNPGWTMLSACTIWKRMLGVLGNISLIRDPLILAEAIKCIEEVWKRLVEVFPWCVCV